MIESICGNCGYKTLHSDDKIGKRYRCSNCKQIVTVQSILGVNENASVTNSYLASIEKAEEERREIIFNQSYNALLKKSSTKAGWSIAFFIIALISFFMAVSGDYGQFLVMCFWGFLGVIFRSKSVEVKKQAEQMKSLKEREEAFQSKKKSITSTVNENIRSGYEKGSIMVENNETKESSIADITENQETKIEEDVIPLENSLPTLTSTDESESSAAYQLISEQEKNKRLKRKYTTFFSFLIFVIALAIISYFAERKSNASANDNAVPTSQFVDSSGQAPEPTAVNQTTLSNQQPTTSTDIIGNWVTETDASAAELPMENYLEIGKDTSIWAIYNNQLYLYFKNQWAGDTLNLVYDWADVNRGFLNFPYSPEQHSVFAKLYLVNKSTLSIVYYGEKFITELKDFKFKPDVQLLFPNTLFKFNQTESNSETSNLIIPQSPPSTEDTATTVNNNPLNEKLVDTNVVPSEKSKVSGSDVKAEETSSNPNNISNTQQKIESPTPVNEEVKDTKASFPGGEQGMKEFLKQNIVFPSNFHRDIGTRMFQFTVREDGKIRNIKFLLWDSVDPLNREGIRVISKMPKWIPAVVEGKPSSSQVTITILFNPFNDNN